MTNFAQTLYTIAIVAAVAVGAYFALQFLGIKRQEMQNEARFQCAQSSRYQTVNGDTTIWYPATELYAACLKEKGIK